MSQEPADRLHDPNIQAVAGFMVGFLFAIPVLALEASLKFIFYYFENMPKILGYILHGLNIVFLLFVCLVILMSLKRKQGNKGVIISKGLCLVLILGITFTIWFKF